MRELTGGWTSLSGILTRKYVCGYCGSAVASEKGWATGNPGGLIGVCPMCNRPTLFEFASDNATVVSQIPGAPAAETVSHLPVDVEQLYAEARAAFQANAPTLCVLSLRKILMHTAVEKGASENQSFVKYVEYLDTTHLIPAGAKDWVDWLREKGNEANHEIKLYTVDEARELLDFTAMMLKNIYEMPARAPKKSKAI